ncbi:MAG: DNA repair protein RecO [bacterium]
MKSYRDQGLIIKLAQLKDADQLVIILGKEHSRIEAIAKSARKSGSHKGGLLDLLNYCNFSFYQGHNLEMITEIELINDFAALKKDLRSVSEIFYLTEILNRFLLESEKNSNYLEHVLELIKLIELNPDQSQILLSTFELQLISAIGFEPELSECIFCKTKFRVGESRIAATKGEPGYLCFKHFPDEQFQKNLVPDQVLKVQKFLLANPLPEALRFNLAPQILMRIHEIQRSWLEGILENRLKSTRFLNLVRNTK